MPGGGTRTFLDTDHYEASLHEAQIEAVIVSRGQFRARLTWAELHHLQMLRCEEDPPHVAYVRLAPRLAFVTFPTNSAPLPVWRGTELQAGDIVFHSRGERLHQFAPGSFVWSVIAIDPAQLEHDGRALTGKRVTPPLEGKLLQPSRRDMARLRRLHAQVCRLAETNSKMLSHPEVARAVEQDLIHALVTCLTTARHRTDGFAGRHHTSIMLRFEEILAENLSHLPCGVMIGVGAAFDFHTGRLRDAPQWIKSSGLQWAHRLCQEPGRLWKRYLVNNSTFLSNVALQLAGLRQYVLDSTSPSQDS